MQFTLWLDEKLVDANQSISVSVNNRTVFKGELPPSKKLTLRREPDGSYLQLLNEPDLRIAGKNASDRLAGIAVQLDNAGNAARIVSLLPDPLKKSKASPQAQSKISPEYIEYRFDIIKRFL